MNEEKIKIKEKNVESNLILITVPAQEFTYDEARNIFNSLKKAFALKDVILIPEGIKMYVSRKELIDIRKRIDEALSTEGEV